MVGEGKGVIEGTSEVLRSKRKFCPEPESKDKEVGHPESTKRAASEPSKSLVIIGMIAEHVRLILRLASPRVPNDRKNLPKEKFMKTPEEWIAITSKQIMRSMETLSNPDKIRLVMRFWKNMACMQIVNHLLGVGTS
ncbi:hypothetical protein H4Q26_009541 [Puccinia striiformis f. sp. tritici PST-130]|nr:hypothetical protein H4Q26_009541 [Puccinia striiformis f. sp. tritici PST-130]